MTERDDGPTEFGSGRGLGLSFSLISLVGWAYWIRVVSLGWSALHRPWQLHLLGVICLIGIASSIAAAVFFYVSRAKFRVGLVCAASFMVVVHLLCFGRTFFLMLDQ